MVLWATDSDELSLSLSLRRAPWCCGPRTRTSCLSLSLSQAGAVVLWATDSDELGGPIWDRLAGLRGITLVSEREREGER